MSAHAGTHDAHVHRSACPKVDVDGAHLLLLAACKDIIPDGGVGDAHVERLIWLAAMDVSGDDECLWRLLVGTEQVLAHRLVVVKVCRPERGCQGQHPVEILAENLLAAWQDKLAELHSCPRGHEWLGM